MALSELEGERPRSEELVRRVLRRYGAGAHVRVILFSLLLTGGLVMVASTDAPAAGLLVPLPGLTAGLYVWALSKRRGELARVARHGVIVDGEATPALCRYLIDTTIAGRPRTYWMVKHEMGWELPRGPIKLLASADARFAIVFAADGSEYPARAWFSEVDPVPLEQRRAALPRMRTHRSSSSIRPPSGR